MMKPIIQDERPLISYEGSPRTDSKLTISEILKRTNQLVRQGDLGRAQGELIAAYREAKENYKKGLILSAPSEKFVSPKTDLTPLPLKPVEALINTISTPKQKADKQSRPFNITPQTISGKSPEQRPEQSGKSIEFNYYRGALEKAWSAGTITEDNQRQLQELRMVLEISDTEHDMLEKEIIQGNNKNNPCIAFEKTTQEYLQFESQLMCTKESESLDRILVIDDEAEYLDILATSMTEDGFNVTAVTTSDEAYALLQEYIPDLILCDINLKTSTMDGFTFYEKIQRTKHLQKIPFVFLTGITDDGLAQKGKELGVDDYLTKPISRKTLMPALRGKIRRFKQLKEN